MNNIKHIGLQILESDIKNFYEEILKFKFERSFVLTVENAINIFGISVETTVLAGECPEMELELFILEKANISTFNHVCFYSQRVEEIQEKANQMGFKIFVLINSGTLFISDSNQNIFEIKQST